MGGDGVAVQFQPVEYFSGISISAGNSTRLSSLPRNHSSAPLRTKPEARERFAIGNGQAKKNPHALRHCGFSRSGIFREVKNVMLRFAALIATCVLSCAPAF